MATIYVKGIDPKLKVKWKKILDNSRFSEALVIEKYMKMVVAEGRIRVEDWQIL